MFIILRWISIVYNTLSKLTFLAIRLCLWCSTVDMNVVYEAPDTLNHCISTRNWYAQIFSWLGIDNLVHLHFWTSSITQCRFSYIQLHMVPDFIYFRTFIFSVVTQSSKTVTEIIMLPSVEFLQNNVARANNISSNELV